MVAGNYFLFFRYITIGILYIIMSYRFFSPKNTELFINNINLLAYPFFKKRILVQVLYSFLPYLSSIW